MAKVNPEDNAFFKDLKFYLTASTARGAMYSYFNLAPRTVVLANSTSPTPNELIGDRLMNFAVGELGIHVVEFKQEAFWNRLSSMFHLDKMPGVVTILLNKVFQWLKKAEDLSTVEFFVQDLSLYACQKGSSRKCNEDTLIGCVEATFHIAREVVRWYNEIIQIGTTEHRDRYAHLDGDFPTNVDVSGKRYKFPIDFSKFLDKKGEHVFPCVHYAANILATDGLTSVGLSSFVKKIKGEFTLKYYLWAVQAQYVQMLVTFEDDMTIIKSYRPHVSIIPIPVAVAMAN